jgi:transposase-like protein
MPWKASTAMSQRLEFVKLASEPQANMRALCREFGITPRTGYKWLQRYRAEGESGLQDRSRCPHRSPHQSPAALEEAVLQVRRAHPAWGARKIGWTLSHEHTRVVRAQLSAIFARYGLPEQMLMDNGSLWKGYHSQLTFWLIRLGIQVLHGRLRHPQTQGKDEGLHRTLKSELLAHHTFLDLLDCQQQFDAWREGYNGQRPHEALGLEPPSAHYQASLRPFTGQLPPIEYEPGDILRKTDCIGRLVYQGQKFRMGKAFHDSLMALRPTPRDGVWDVFFCKQRIAQIRLNVAQP